MKNENVPLIVGGSLTDIASVKNVFGEAIDTQGRTIVPVARIVMGMGGGFGEGSVDKSAGNSHKNSDQEKDAKGTGNGAGGGVYAVPKGVYEISGKGTRFIPVRSSKSWLLGSIVSFLVGCWITNLAKGKQL